MSKNRLLQNSNGAFLTPSVVSKMRLHHFSYLNGSLLFGAFQKEDLVRVSFEIEKKSHFPQ